jgi:glyoxylase I family protein
MAIKVEGVCPFLTVFDMRRAIEFYHDLLGFEVIAQSQAGKDFDWALMRLNDAQLMLNTAYERDERPPTADPNRIAAHIDTALFFGRRDLDSAFEYLRSRRVDVDEPVTRDYDMKQLYLTDPDGYNLCFQWPTA